MPSSMMRVSERTHKALRELADQTGESMQAILDKAVEEYQRRRFLEEVNAAFAALRADPELWNEELEERTEWDATLLDGIEDE